MGSEHVQINEETRVPEGYKVVPLTSYNGLADAGGVAVTFYNKAMVNRQTILSTVDFTLYIPRATLDSFVAFLTDQGRISDENAKTAAARGEGNKSTTVKIVTGKTDGGKPKNEAMYG